MIQNDELLGDLFPKDLATKSNQQVTKQQLTCILWTKFQGTWYFYGLFTTCADPLTPFVSRIDCWLKTGGFCQHFLYILQITPDEQILLSFLWWGVEWIFLYESENKQDLPMFPFQPEPMAGTSSHMPWLPFCQAWSIPKFRFTNLWGPNTSVLLMFDITMLLFQPGPMAGISASWSWPLVLQVWCSLIISLAYASGPTIYQRAHVDDSSLWLLTVLAVLVVLSLRLEGIDFIR